MCVPISPCPCCPLYIWFALPANAFHHPTINLICNLTLSITLFVLYIPLFSWAKHSHKIHCKILNLFHSSKSCFMFEIYRLFSGFTKYSSYTTYNFPRTTDNFTRTFNTQPLPNQPTTYPFKPFLPPNGPQVLHFDLIQTQF